VKDEMGAVGFEDLLEMGRVQNVGENDVEIRKRSSIRQG